MGDIIPFQFEGIDIRFVTDDDGQPAAVAKDFAAALKYVNTNAAIDRHCRGVAKQYPIVDSLGRPQNVRIISEPDMYRLIIGSKLPEAERFERLVFEDILPSIRKTGSYGTTTSPALPDFSTPERMVQLANILTTAAKRTEQAELERDVQSQRAALAEEDVAAFQNDTGLVVRAFIQKHFPDERESTLWSFFYGRGYVVNDPRGRWSETQQKRIPGPNHHMPLQPGREWFHAPEQLDRNKKPRRQLRVRRDRELDLVTHLERHGFTSIRSTSLDVFESSPTPLRAV